jgi:hypothetical protein
MWIKTYSRLMITPSGNAGKRAGPPARSKHRSAMSRFAMASTLGCSPSFRMRLRQRSMWCARFRRAVAAAWGLVVLDDVPTSSPATPHRGQPIEQLPSRRLGFDDALNVWRPLDECYRLHSRTARRS